MRGKTGADAALWLVLCHRDDECAIWIYDGLKHRGFLPIELVFVEDLAPSQRWWHRIRPQHVEASVSFSKGFSLTSAMLRGVINRARYVPEWIDERKLAAEDREYAKQELAAFLVGWLYALPPPILNRPTPLGLGGRVRSAAEWTLLASGAGLSTSVLHRSSLDSAETPSCSHDSMNDLSTVLVVGEDAFGAKTESMEYGCRLLARAAGVSILGVTFRSDDSGNWNFHGASTHPDLRIGGEYALDSLARALQSGRGGS
jgi:hypothetical protein